MSTEVQTLKTSEVSEDCVLSKRQICNTWGSKSTVDVIKETESLSKKDHFLTNDKLLSFHELARWGFHVFLQ